MFRGLAATSLLTALCAIPTNAAAGHENLRISVQRFDERGRCEAFLARGTAALKLRHPAIAAEGPVARFVFDGAHAMLEAQDRAALSAMVARGVISREEASLSLAETRSIDPGRLTYVLISDGSAGEAHTHLRMVGGQLRGENLDLPWMRRLPELARERVDRARQKHIYEWGRAVTAGGEGLTRRSVGLMSAVAAADVLGAGGSLEEAFIYLRTTRPANTRLFRRAYGFELLGSSPAGGSGAVLARRLDSLFDEFGAPYLHLLPGPLGELGRRALLLYETAQGVLARPHHAAAFQYRGPELSPQLARQWLSRFGEDWKELLERVGVIGEGPVLEESEIWIWGPGLLRLRGEEVSPR